MSEHFQDSLPPPIRSVLHPSDLTAASDLAFAHALKIALIRQTKFEILHVNQGDTPWHKFPAVRDTLERWGVLEPGTPRDHVLRIAGIDVAKVAPVKGNPVTATLRYLKKHPMDLLVLATAGREGAVRWLRPSVAERLARRARTMTLFVPATARGFVSPKDGTIDLGRVLVPIARDPDGQPAVDAVARVFTHLEQEPELVRVAHVGDESAMPEVRLPNEHWPWERVALRGDVRDSILAAAHDMKAQLIIMVTRGPQGLGDWFRGSDTERILRQAPCPVLALPARDR